ncbi:MAG: GNAT family N-acetyltransferase [Woeseiaceae bacterium]|nr:GNAT family N-acetyltransferase [Woeseiaceae bacterium]
MFRREGLTSSEQSAVSDGFRVHGEELGAPDYKKEQVKWVVLDEQDDIGAVLAADILWDWMYIDELWTSPELRGDGLGRELMRLAEAFAASEGLQGIWLWTQSWQAEGFYKQLGYDEFTRFDDFPRDHARIGFRKTLS